MQIGDLVRYRDRDCIGVVLFVGEYSVEVRLLSNQDTVWSHSDNLEKIA